MGTTRACEPWDEQCDEYHHVRRRQPGAAMYELDVSHTCRHDSAAILVSFFVVLLARHYSAVSCQITAAVRFPCQSVVCQALEKNNQFWHRKGNKEGEKNPDSISDGYISNTLAEVGKRWCSQESQAVISPASLSSSSSSRRLSKAIPSVVTVCV